jgi:flagellar biosynthesis/type III secretory pathway ATPase
MAQREIGLSGRNPTRGYPQPVFALLPRLLERAGAGGYSSITGLYTVLVEADDLSRSAAQRSILDGHIALSAAHPIGHFPSIDVLASCRVATTC